MARLARFICVGTGVALAVWLSSASIHIIEWAAAGPTRVALLPPLWHLVVALGVTVAAAIVVAVVLDKRGEGHSAVSAAIGPLALLWLWVVPYLPWLPDRAPALLLFAGPMRWVVLTSAIAGSAAHFWPSGATAGLARLAGRRAIAGISFAIYLGFGLWSATAVGPGADEPHYLVITQSLLKDHDLAIENNHARGDYREYFGGELRPDFLRRGLNEVIYSIHAPGLPALLVPAYAVGGYLGTVAMLCVFGALAALAIFDLAALLAGPGAALVTWAAVCLTVPFVPHSWLIFPEMPGALLMAWAALWLYAPLPARARTWVWRGAALAILPWLHTKFVILLAAMLAALLLRLWRRPTAGAALVAPAIVSLALWVYSFYVLYGAFDPQIPYGDFPKLYVLFANIPRGVLGLLFDQKFGLLVYAPIYGLAIAGCWTMIRRPDLRLFTAALLGTVAAFVASSTRMYMWWGGSSAPARFLVPILPLLAPMLAVAFQSMRSTAARAISGLLLIASLAVGFAGIMSPQRFMLFSAPHGFANLAVAMQGPSPLSYLLPTFTEGEIRAPLLLLAPWAVAAIVAWAVAVMLSRGRRSTGAFGVASTGLAVFVASGSVLAGAPAPSSQRRAAVLHGRLELMRAYDGPALRGFDFARGTSMGDQDLLQVSAIHLTRVDRELATDATTFAGPLDLPAGRFTARVAVGGELRDEGSPSVTVLLGDQTPIASGPANGLTSLGFELPIDAPIRLAAPDQTTALAVQQLDIVATSIVPRHVRAKVDARAIEPIVGRRGAFVIYADEATYPEGGVFWTQGTRAGTVFVAPVGASTLVLTLHVGSAAGLVRVMVDGQDRSMMLSRDQTIRTEIPLRPSARLVPVVVEAPGSFRPFEHDPTSTDRRRLGCQVRVELQ